MSTRTLLISQPSPVQSQYLKREGLVVPEPRFCENPNISTETVNHRPYHKSSSGLVTSLGSRVRQPLQVSNENIPTQCTPLPLTPNEIESYKTRSAVGDASQQPSYGSGPQTRSPISPNCDALSSFPEVVVLSNSDLNAGHGEGLDLDDAVVVDGCEWKPEPSVSFDSKREEALPKSNDCFDGDAKNIANQPSKIVLEETSHPIRRWMSTFHRKKSTRKRPLSIRRERWVLDEFEENTPPSTNSMHQTSRSDRRKTMSSISSSGFVTAMQSARATSSVAPTPRKTRRSAILRNSNRSSKLSHATNRASMDSSIASTAVIDEAAWNRAVQRRRALEELISSEESYIADLKVLVNVYLTLLVPSLSVSQHISQRTSAQIHLNVKEMLSLHEELLMRLKKVIPHSEMKSVEPSRNRYKHARWHSFDASQRSYKMEVLQVARRSLEVTGFRQAQRDSLVSEPWEVAEVSRIFDHLMGRFFIYEEYGAKYESMAKAMTSTSKAIPTWQAYERGIEALANSLASTNGEDSQRKGLTFGDLLIKPIQRICKYPLIYADIYRNTPVFDCPNSHAAVEQTLSRLREMTIQTNKATSDRQTQTKIRRAWQLQDILTFPDTFAAPITIRQLGHPILCGVLYVAYQGQDRVYGVYMLCVLFKSCLLLATPRAGGLQYDIVATIYPNSLRIESSESGRGLLCYNALFSWKVVLESDHQFFELIMCACSLREEEQWKISIAECCTAYDQSTSPALYPILTFNIRPIGSIFDITASLTRNFPTRAATVNPRTSVTQVIIKNTYALKETGDTQQSGVTSISRSQSLFSSSRIPILAPRRADRIRMEQSLSEVWTRELLPYPGMGASRGEQIIRASASSVMRKLSMASIATTFTIRSVSHMSLAEQILGTERAEIESITGTDGAYDTALPRMPVMNASYSSRNRYRAVQQVIPPLRISSLRSMGRSKSVKDYPQPGRNTSATNQVDHGTPEDAFVGTVRHTEHDKRSRPGGLLKSFSTYGMKGWFG